MSDNLKTGLQVVIFTGVAVLVFTIGIVCAVVWFAIK